MQLRALLEAGFGGAIPTSLAERMAKRAERTEPGLLLKAMSGLGGIETSRPAIDMWRLGRMVDRSASLSAAFASGVDGLEQRLRDASAADAEIAGFVDRFDEVLARHGHRGPNEVELASETWATNPELVLAIVERLRLSAESADPEEAARRLATERAAARQRLRRSVAPPLRPVVSRLLDRSAAAPPAASRPRARS